MTRISRRTRLATAGVLAPLALGLVACGGDDNGDVATPTSETSAATDHTATDDTATDDGAADGVENDVDLGPDATTVTRGPVADTNDDNDDDAERELLLGAPVDYLAAIEPALGQVQGTVTGVDLSEDNGVAVWDVQFNEDTADETTVDIDAQSGGVLQVERDD